MVAARLGAEPANGEDSLRTMYYGAVQIEGETLTLEVFDDTRRAIDSFEITND